MGAAAAYSGGLVGRGWIPAFAGMAVMRAVGMTEWTAAAPTVIPAQAGIQNSGKSWRGDRPGCGFPLSRE